MSSPIKHHVWTVKLSKLCDLRCRYCYEWPHLAKPQQMSPELWRRICPQIRTAAERCGADEVWIVWQGGEPLMLPEAYRSEIMEIADAELASPLFRVGHAIQTNLYRLSDQALDWIRRWDFTIGVSYDGAAGAREDARGADCGSVVERNIERVRCAGAPFYVHAVLGRHNQRRLRALYDFAREAGAVRLLITPLGQAPGAPVGDLALNASEAAETLIHLFEHWQADDFRLPVSPLTRYREVAANRVLGLDAALPQSARFVIEPDGSVFPRPGLYEPGEPLGSLADQTLERILASPRAAAAREYDDRLLDRQCRECRYESHCGKRDAVENPLGAGNGPCLVAAETICAIEQRLSAFAPALYDLDPATSLPERCGG